jgi:peptidoglycan/LPS O-acetylase OafA/YrhL
MAMDQGRSLFLDAARFVAACAVVLHHAFSSGYLEPPIHINGRTAVMVFFVISGFVIAYVSDTVERDYRSYVIARVSRIYSVAIPALLLTLLADSIGMRIDDSWYVAAAHEQIPARLLISLMFINEWWNLTVSALSNGPYWSLSYEVCYYVLFGIFCFVRRPVVRYGAAMLVVAAVGPRILLLFPVWLIGVICYRLARRTGVSGNATIFALVLSAVHFALVVLIGTPVSSFAMTVGDSIAGDGYLHLAGFRFFLGGDRYFLDDLYVGCSFALLLFFSAPLGSMLHRRDVTKTFIRGAARHTFSIYLYHAPLLALFAAMSSHNPTRKLNLILILVLTFAVVLALSEVTEQQRPKLRKWLERRWMMGRALGGDTGIVK